LATVSYEYKVGFFSKKLRKDLVTDFVTQYYDKKCYDKLIIFSHIFPLATVSYEYKVCFLAKIQFIVIGE
jgi:hypothetical protein